MNRTFLAAFAFLALACTRPHPGGTPREDSLAPAAAPTVVEIPAESTPAAPPAPRAPAPTPGGVACGSVSRADRGDPAAPTPADAFAAASAHFLAFGDSGTGDPAQFFVAAAMKRYCLASGCDFALHTGDIFYPVGTMSTTDSRLRDRFEGPYAPLGIPIHMSLGNHDYYPPASPEAAIQYTHLSPSKAWHLPARNYTFLEHGIRFLALDTNRPNVEQEAWALEVLARSRRDGEGWVIAFGHHPRLSDGRHGDADGDVGPWLDRILCHRVDLLISGHDHVLEVMKPRCGVHQVVTGGGGAELYDLAPTTNGRFEARSHGFVALTVKGPELHANFIDQDSNKLCEMTWQKASNAEICGADGICNGRCPSDPDCAKESCGTNSVCNLACTDDPDCLPPGACGCDREPLICEVRSAGSSEICGCDAACQVIAKVCTADGTCDSGCRPGSDPDCR